VGSYQLPLAHEGVALVLPGAALSVLAFATSATARLKGNLPASLAVTRQWQSNEGPWKPEQSLSRFSPSHSFQTDESRFRTSGLG
jgi:hypothetical protein